MSAVHPIRTVRPRAAALLAAALACTPAAPPTTQPAASPAGPAAGRRAILVSLDAINERRLRETVSAEATPALRALFDGGVCAAGARPAFPSLTAPGHASLWTGAYGDVTGVAGNSQPTLPQPTHTLLESSSGYLAPALRAEPIWLAAAEAGLAVYGHHVTQAPGAPGYAPVREPEPRLDSLRAAAERLLAEPRLQVVNGYNVQLSGPRALTERDAPPRPAAGWRNLDRLGATRPPLEISWTAGRDTLFALLYGAERVDRALVARTRDAAAGVVATAAPVERAPLAGRELGRHFSAALPIEAMGGRVFLRARLFEAAPDGSRFLLFVSELRVVQGNRPEVTAAYDAGVDGWYGNSGLLLTERGALGTPLWEGGDGTAELRYLETAELMTRHFVRGAEWAWTTQRPALLLDYFPAIDEIDHSPLFGLTRPEAPGYDPTLAARLQPMRERVWQLADLRLAHLRRLVGDDPNARLFVSGDHGMRLTWRLFRPNVALAEAGLLARDSAGRIDLSRTRALSPNGYWVSVNRTAWRGGIVPPAEEAAVLAAARQALEGARGPDGRPIVTRIWRGDEADSLGIGGPTGGDLYFDLAEGYYFNGAPGGPLTAPTSPRGNHGFPSPSPEMQTVFCMAGPGVAPRRIGPARTIDVAPTVAEWLGIRKPAHAVGISRLGEMMGGR